MYNCEKERAEECDRRLPGPDVQPPRTVGKDVFDELRHLEREGARFDTIILDPPAFAKNKASIPKALAGYKDITFLDTDGKTIPPPQ